MLLNIRLLTLLCARLLILTAAAKIDRKKIVSKFNPTRNASSLTTPMQVGNGNFAFGADITGLQTFLPYAIMSTWGLKNDTLPPNKTQQDVDNYKGVSWLNHGRPVQYDFNSGDPTLEQWMISNPNRANLGRVSLVAFGENGEEIPLSENDLASKSQTLDLWTGTLKSSFSISSQPVTVITQSAMDSDTISISISSPQNLGLKFDFPWNDGSQKFSAPFVGSFNESLADEHTTGLVTDTKLLGKDVMAQITHTMVTTTFYTSLRWSNGHKETTFQIRRVSPTLHQYILSPASFGPSSTDLTLSIAFSPNRLTSVPSPQDVSASATHGWEAYWSSGGFVDLISGSTDPRAMELQRRVVLSQYLLRVNEAGDTPPQESGLVNDGWYGKFHMEMFWWHSGHWATWNQWSVLNRATSIYSRFLPSSLQRAQIQQGWPQGARWPKMTDPTGRSAPGEINNLLIWQQPHPLVFAELEWRAFPHEATLKKWDAVVKATADWMSVFAWLNTTQGGTGKYDLGPPMFVVSEDTSPNITVNPSFELTYWKFGMGIAQRWMRRSGQPIPDLWTQVANALSPLPVNVNDTDKTTTYSVYEGIEPDFWDDKAFTNDHPSLVGLYGWLPLTEGVDLSIAKATMDKVATHWNISNCWGWDFPMLALSSARHGESSQAINWLLHPLFQFDDVGMPIGGVRVPTPYFPGSGSLLYAVGMMAAGWDGDGVGAGAAPGFPGKEDGWEVKVEGISKSL